MDWIAERFFKGPGAWLDIASGRAVRLRLLPSAATNELAWNDQCARLSTMRHPLLNTLVDYGPAARDLLFEAYEAGEPLQASGAGAEELLEQVTRFLRARDVEMPPDRAVHALRPVGHGRAAPGRPLALTIQGRRALEAIEEALDGLGPSGPVVLTVSGPVDAGLRTVRTLTARSARIRGFVPVSPQMVLRYPGLRESLHRRHVCLLDDLADPARSAAAVARMIAEWSARSTRRHAVVRFRRAVGERAGGILLEPLGREALVRMVFTSEGKPTDEELRVAAGAADGLPGAFLARLCGPYPIRQTALLVHETAPAYRCEPEPASPPLIGGRVLGSALRAAERAVALARRGRHGSAQRLLERAVRVLDGRDRRREASRCAMLLGWLALDRGHTAEARGHFARARVLDSGAAAVIEASIGTGVAMIDDRQLAQAEAALRGAVAAAETIHDQELAAAAAAALARTLLWQQRFDEAIAVASQPREGCAQASTLARLGAVAARAHARLGRAALAVRTARAAQQAAARADPRAQATAERALAEALLAGGDREGARAALTRAIRTARAHHLPLARVRALLVLPAAGAPGRAVRPLDRLRRLPLPELLSHRVQQAEPAPAAPARGVEPVAILERLLDLSQRADDDAAAVTAVCGAAAERLSASAVAIYGRDERALAVHGRGWSTAPDLARQVLAHGAPGRPDGRHEPQECAEPVRFGGEVIGALVCRWSAGTAVDVDGAVMFLRAAALTVAPHVRALVERAPALPASAWPDLIGESEAASALREAVGRAARAPFPVLVEGESGCGKELVARAIHRLSPRRERRFCALNCAALTDDLVETELFGHARGAFTGAAGERAGLFEEGDGGTVFLDEVGELSARAQAKLLRVLQEGEVRRVGENLPRRVDVRVVAATNRQLEEEVQGGRFRADLRFRLDVVRIVVPPLRERASDIPLLAARFWQDAAARVGSRATLSADALAALARYDWPGNVRELQNVMAWIAVQSPRRGRMGASALPRHVAQATVPAHRTFEAARVEFERRFVRAALAGANGQRTRAAEALGVTRQGLAKMMRRLGIEGA
jgi:DNA-binding NtrC family response regulator/tetratricopeptide (TPR) repeat protein